MPASTWRGLNGGKNHPEKMHRHKNQPAQRSALSHQKPRSNSPAPSQTPSGAPQATRRANAVIAAGQEAANRCGCGAVVQPNHRAAEGAPQKTQNAVVDYALDPDANAAKWSKNYCLNQNQFRK